MDDLLSSLLAVLITVVGAACLLACAATLGGTLLWIIYPHIHSLFPSAAANGIIAQDLTWWDSVCLVWLSGILIKGHVTYKKK